MITDEQERRFNDMRQLKDNWDSYGARPPTKAEVDVAYTLLADCSLDVEELGAACDGGVHIMLRGGVCITVEE